MSYASEPDAATPAPAPPPSAPGYRRVATRLRQDIVDGAIAPGQWLRLQSVAEACGVSVQPVREALQVLEGEGLVQIFPNRGARVRGIDRQRIEHIYDIREAIEAMLTRRFCQQASASCIDRLVEIQERHDETSRRLDAAATSAANFEFHHLIHSHAGNPEAMALVERYTELGHSLHRRFHGDHAGFERAATEHHMLIDAFRARDVEAAGMMSHIHVSGTRRALLSRIDATDPGLVQEQLRSGRTSYR